MACSKVEDLIILPKSWEANMVSEKPRINLDELDFKIGFTEVKYNDNPETTVVGVWITTIKDKYDVMSYEFTGNTVEEIMANTLVCFKGYDWLKAFFQRLEAAFECTIS